MTERPDLERIALRARIEPRGLSRDEAARYLGIGTTLFDELVATGRMPRPVRIGRRVIWDRFKLDDAFDQLSEDDGANKLDQVMFGGSKE